MKANRIKIILIILFLVSCTVTFLFSSYFDLENVVIEKDDMCKINILEKYNIEIGENLNLLMLSEGNILSGHLVKVEEEILNDVNIRDISIKRSGKNDLLINCLSRVPIMCIQQSDYMIYFDYDGTLIDTSSVKNEKSIMIKGVNLDFFYFGQNILTCNYMLKDISVLCKEIEKYDLANYTAIRALIDEIEILDNNRAVIRYDNRLEILMDMTKDVKYNANVMCSILTNIDQNDKGYIDFTISSTPFFNPASD